MKNLNGALDSIKTVINSCIRLSNRKAFIMSQKQKLNQIEQQQNQEVAALKKEHQENQDLDPQKKLNESLNQKNSSKENNSSKNLNKTSSQQERDVLQSKCITHTFKDVTLYLLYTFKAKRTRLSQQEQTDSDQPENKNQLTIQVIPNTLLGPQNANLAPEFKLYIIYKKRINDRKAIKKTLYQSSSESDVQEFLPTVSTKGKNYLKYLQYVDKHKDQGVVSGLADIAKKPKIDQSDPKVKQQSLGQTPKKSSKVEMLYQFLIKIMKILTQFQHQSNTDLYVTTLLVMKRKKQLDDLELQITNLRAEIQEQRQIGQFSKDQSSYKTSEQKLVDLLRQRDKLKQDCQSCKYKLQNFNDVQKKNKAKYEDFVQCIFEKGKAYLMISKEQMQKKIEIQPNNPIFKKFFLKTVQEQQQSKLNIKDYYIIELPTQRLKQDEFFRQMAYLQQQSWRHKRTLKEHHTPVLRQLHDKYKQSQIYLRQTIQDFLNQATKNIKYKIRANVRTRRGRISKSSLQLPQEYRLGTIDQDDQIYRDQTQTDKKKIKKLKRQQKKAKRDGIKTLKRQFGVDEEVLDYRGDPIRRGDSIRIPIQMDDQSTSYYHFTISGNVIAKLGGAWYQPMFLKYRLPRRGKHFLGVKIFKTQKAVFWFGIIAEKSKYFVHSSIPRNYFVYKSNTCQLMSNIEGVQVKRKTRCQMLYNKDAIQMQIDMDNWQITWVLSNGGVAIGQIPEQLKKFVLVPFVTIYTTYDSLQFIP